MSTIYSAVIIADASLVHNGRYRTPQDRADDVLDILQSNYQMPEDFTESEDPDERIQDAEQALVADGVDIHLTEDDVEDEQLPAPLYSLVTEDSSGRSQIWHTTSAREMSDLLLEKISGSSSAVLTRAEHDHAPSLEELQQRAQVLLQAAPAGGPIRATVLRADQRSTGTLHS